MSRADFILIERLIVALNVEERGTRRFADGDIEHFMRFLFVVSVAEARPETITTDMARQLGQLAVDAGCKPGDPPAQVLSALMALFDQRPPSPEMITIYNRVAREVAVEGHKPEAGRAFGNFLGRSGTAGVLGGGQRPAGTVPAGPLARVATMKK